MGKKLTDFINRLDEEAKKNRDDLEPEKRINAFNDQVNALYAEIDSWLLEEIESGKVKTGTVQINITEDRLGTYPVDEKWIQVGYARIQLQPIGTMLIGTDARIDMTYRNNDVMLIRAGVNVKSPYDFLPAKENGRKPNEDETPGEMVWKYVKEGRQLSYVTLNKDRFEDLIIDIIDGNL